MINIMAQTYFLAFTGGQSYKSDNKFTTLKKYLSNYNILQTDNLDTNIYISINHNTEHKKFCEILASSRNFVFFPKVFETLSRVCIEANCLNTDIIGNQNIAYLLETWSNLRGLELINFLRDSKEKTVKIFEN